MAIDGQRTAVDVVVIGGGWSGLMAAKYALAYGFTVRLLERREQVGGVWAHTPGEDAVTVADYTRTTSSRLITEASDFPFPDAYGPFPRHDQIHQYLLDYATHFDLWPHIRTGVAVTASERLVEGWRVHTSEGALECRFLVVSTGTHARPNRAAETLLAGFEGEIVHALALKARQALLERTRGKRVLFLGGGETAADMVEVVARHGDAARVDWSIPNGQRFFRKYGSVPGLMPPQVWDEAIAKAYLDLAPYDEGKPGFAMWCRFSTAGTPTAYDGHNVLAWRTTSANFRSAFNKNGAVLDHVYDGAVGAKRRPVGVRGRRVEFDVGEAAEYDLVISCFGYRPAGFGFLPETHRVAPHRCWRLIFPPQDPQLFFVGYARPIIGSFPIVAEFQCKAVMQVASGRATLPADLPAAIEAEVAEREAYFADTSRRIRTLIEPSAYLFQLMADADFAIDYAALRRARPLDWFFLYFSPLHASMLHYHDPARRAEVVRTYRRTFRREFLTGYWIILASRYLGLDAATERYGEVKAALETRFPRLRRSRVLDGAWTAYRRTFFNRASLFSRRVVPHYVACDPADVRPVSAPAARRAAPRAPRAGRGQRGEPPPASEAARAPG